ncbi:Gfo/Idh/MocA family protein [Microbacterium sp. cf332]|uniref:Gfo/Idh/MocA family protein n=1 Tax=Microbacterium sp. cf332 TaxID=1761804 RepID=UPI0008867268|nr:Gfo/Idh/MocA family oxidoreductase [Microbacterium sp. cf332]SDQ43689.1 Oxidoreductase family, NAD-binding Rossmann fold [Microbacterium sp. cf332]
MSITFAIVGSGWRSEFFLRIAAALPERFRVSGLVTRSSDTAAAVERRWGVRGHRDLDDLLAAGTPDFVVVSVPRDVAPSVIVELVERGIPVLTETPPAGGLDDLHRLWDRVGGAGTPTVQVAEQYHLSPLLSAQLAVARSGRLGRPTQALVAQCHDYHGISVMRRALGVGSEEAEITASVFRSPLVAGPGRDGDPVEERIVTATQTTARFEFGDRLGVYDFAGEQYFSWIRGNRLLVRGERGEIENGEVRYLRSYDEPVFDTLRRVMTGEGGNLEGMFLRGILLGDEWVFRNPFSPARLNDDEIAIARMLDGMPAAIAGGPAVYSLAEASQDHYLALLMQRAADTGERQRSTVQPWADALGLP